MVSNQGILDWIHKNKVKTNKGLPVEFHDHGFLLDYVKDTHNRIVVRKCTHPDTKVLTADLKWTAVKDVKIGQSLVGVTEDDPVGKGNRRKLEETVVLDSWRVKKEAFKMTLEDGRSIIASADHPFLSMTTRGKKKNQFTWHKLSSLRVNDYVRIVFDIWNSSFWKGLALGLASSTDTKVKIVSIEPVGKIDLIDIETSNHTFIAEGIATHNCTQVGASFSTNIKMLHLGSQAPLTTIYTLPTSSEAKNFVLTKFDPMIERSPGLLDMVKKVVLRERVLYNTVVKRIGPSYYFFRGSWTTWGAQSIDADVLVVDELDFQKPDVRQMWEERTEGSASQDVIYWIGYPSIPNFGIEELYENSDKRMWFIECPHCKKRQVLEFPDNIDMDREVYVCKFCHGELSDNDRRKGLWKKTQPGKDIHGYWINKLMAPWISAAKIIDRFKKDTPKKFHNYTLGLPYISKETELSDVVIQNAMIEEEEYNIIKSSDDVHVICGMDQGDIFHLLTAIVTENVIVVIAAEQLRTEADVMKRLRHYSPELLVMDMFPNRHTAKNICAEYGSNKVFMAKERNWTETSKQRNYWNLNRSTSEVGIERTESIDAMIEYIIKGVIKFRRTIPRLTALDKKDPGVIQQLKNLVPDTQERHGRMRRVFKAVGPEHYGHALNFIVTAAHIVLPGWQSRQALIPSSYMDELKNKKKLKPWYHQEFENLIRGLNPHDAIIIKPGGEIIEPGEDPFNPRAC